MHAGECKEEIMADFPSNLKVPSLADHAALSQLYTAAPAPTNMPGHEALRLQLKILEQHVRACVALWELIGARRLPRGVDWDQRYGDALAERTRSM